MRYLPRNDFVLFRLVNVGLSAGGVVIPDVSRQGKERIVVAMGPDVEDLKIGDRILVIGEVGHDVVELPATMKDAKGLFLTKQQNVVLVCQDVEDESDDDSVEEE